MSIPLINGNSFSEWDENLGIYCIKIFKNKQMILATEYGSQLPAAISSFELDDPYRLIISGKINVKHSSYVNANSSMGSEVSFDCTVQKEDLAIEFRNWLDGNEIKYPCIFLNKSQERSIIEYIKFGSIPSKENLILWVLSRLEIKKGRQFNQADCIFGGSRSTSSSAGLLPPDLHEVHGNSFKKSSNNDLSFEFDDNDDLHINPYSKAAELYKKTSSSRNLHQQRRSTSARAATASNNGKPPQPPAVENMLSKRINQTVTVLEHQMQDAKKHLLFKPGSHYYPKITLK